MTSQVQAQEVLAQMPAAVRALRRAREATEGRPSMLIDWPCGLALRVTAREARVYAEDADQELVHALLQSGMNFTLMGAPDG